MKKLSLWLTTAVVALGLGAQPASAVPLVQLGFLVDSSGSIGAGNFTTIRNGISNAFLNVLPTDGSVEVTVVRFATNANTIVAPTIINSALTLSAVAAAVQAMTYTGGSTNMDVGLSLLNSIALNHNFQGAGQVYNVVTDGLPSSQAQAVLQRNAAIALGLDELDAEFLGTIGSPGYNFLLNSLVFPQPGHAAPPYDPGFVVAVGFDNFEAAFQAKLVAVTQPIPEPGTLLLIGSGLTGLVLRRRRRA